MRVAVLVAVAALCAVAEAGYGYSKFPSACNREGQYCWTADRQTGICRVFRSPKYPKGALKCATMVGPAGKPGPRGPRGYPGEPGRSVLPGIPDKFVNTEDSTNAHFAAYCDNQPAGAPYAENSCPYAETTSIDPDGSLEVRVFCPYGTFPINNGFILGSAEVVVEQSFATPPTQIDGSKLYGWYWKLVNDDDNALITGPQVVIYCTPYAK